MIFSPVEHWLANMLSVDAVSFSGEAACACPGGSAAEQAAGSFPQQLPWQLPAAPEGCDGVWAPLDRHLPRLVRLGLLLLCSEAVSSMPTPLR